MFYSLLYSVTQQWPHVKKERTGSKLRQQKISPVRHAHNRTSRFEGVEHITNVVIAARVLIKGTCWGRRFMRLAPPQALLVPAKQCKKQI